MPFKKFSLIFLTIVSVGGTLSCASSDAGVGQTHSDSEEPNSSQKTSKKTKSNVAKASKSSKKSNPETEETPTAPRAKKTMTTGKIVRVTMSFGSEGALDGTVSSQILGEVLPAVDSLSRKEPENLSLAVTHMGLLRMANQADDMPLFQKRSSSGGSQDPWFLIESGYGAVKRKNFSFAEYLFSKAEKISQDPYSKAAAANGFGLRYWAEGNLALAAKEAQRAVSFSDSYAPAIVSLAFLSLRAGDYVGAEQQFRRSASLLPQSATVKLGLAASMRLQGKISEAADILRPLSKSKSNDKRIVWNLALALGDDPPRKGEALQLLKQYFSMAGVFPDLDSRANALQNRLNLPPPAPQKPPQQPVGKWDS